MNQKANERLLARVNALIDGPCVPLAKELAAALREAMAENEEANQFGEAWMTSGLVATRERDALRAEAERLREVEKIVRSLLTEEERASLSGAVGPMAIALQALDKLRAEAK